MSGSTNSLVQRVVSLLRDVPDFPKPGILFKDITPLLQDPAACKAVTLYMADQMRSQKADAIAAIESRGFLFGMLLAQELQLPFIPIRKAGKLPFDCLKQSYALEYGTATVEMHTDAIASGKKVWLHDDVLATGGTAIAAAKLIEQAGATVAGFSFVIELGFLKGKENLAPFSKNICTLAGC